MKLPKPKKNKKMQGPMKFVKNGSKRKRPPQKFDQKKSRSQGSKKQISDRITQSIAINQRAQKQLPKVRKVVQKLISTLAPNQERLEKHLAQSGLTSRREAKSLIQKGLVTVNGKTIREPGFGIEQNDIIKIMGGSQESKETILLYKPRGIETIKTDPANTDIHDRFPQFKHLNPIGRLDKDSEGLILLSNDGVLTRIITGSGSTTEKEYRVTVREDVMPALLSKMEQGIMLDKVRTKPCTTKKLGQHEYTITLTEGRKHQVRRMANACKFTVTKLVRIRIGNLTIGKMTSGNFKKLTSEQISDIKK